MSGRNLIFAAAFAGLVAFCPAAISTETNSATADEIDVYSTLLQKNETWLIQPQDPSHIARTKEQVLAYAKKLIGDEKLVGDEKEAAEDWVRKVYEPNLFTNKLSLPIKWQLVTEQDFASFPKEESRAWWDAFRKKYPGVKGIVTASRVGMSNDRQTAFLHWTTSVGPLGVESSYLVLKKRDGRWRVERMLQTIMA